MVVCAVAAAAWVLLAGAILVGRFRARHAATSAAGRDGRRVARAATGAHARGARPSATPRMPARYLLRALRSDDPDLRTASITALGRLGGTSRMGDRRPRRGARAGLGRRRQGRDRARHAGAAAGPAVAAAPRAPERRRSVLRRAAAGTLPVARRASRPGHDHGSLSQRPGGRARDASRRSVRGGASLRTASARRPQPARARACESYGIDHRTAHRRVVPRAAPGRPLVVGTRGRPRGPRGVGPGRRPCGRAGARERRPGAADRVPRSSSRTSGLSTSWFGDDDVGSTASSGLG